MSLDVINQQGAQVVALQQRLSQVQGMLLLALKDAPPQLTFSKADVAKSETIESVDWKIARNGTVTVSVRRKKKDK